MLVWGQENAPGDRRLHIDPSCKALIADLEDVVWKVDAHGVTYSEIDKRNPKLTHTSDAVGYYIESEHGLGFQGGARRESY